MNLISDAWLVLHYDGAPVLLVLVCILWGSLMIAAVLHALPGLSREPAEMFALALGGWMAPILLCSAVILLLGIFLHLRPGAATVATCLAVSAAWALWSIGRAHDTTPAISVMTVLILAASFLSMALLRLAFVVRLPLPMYFDSAEHYRIVHELMGDYFAAGTSLLGAWPAEDYYHLGYHAVLAVIAALSMENVGQLMLVSGVIALAALPLPLFVIAYRETGSRLAGLLAVVLGSLGWYMPGHVLNWGKYPALFAIPVVLFTLAAAYLSHVADEETRARRGLRILAMVGACVALAIHTRSIILLGILLLAWLLSDLWAGRPAAQQRLIAVLVFAALLAEVLVFARNALWSSLLDPYLGAGIWITALVGVLAMFAFRKYPRLAFASVLALVLLCLGLFIPVPGFASSPLLDRPLVEMVLFVPLALLGAAGFAALGTDLKPHGALLRVGAGALLTIVVAVHASARYSFYPSDCCTLVKDGDLAALEWLQRTVPSDARVLVPFAELSDTPLPYPPLKAAADAGAWILPLTGKETLTLPYWTDFADPRTFTKLCQLRVGYIFVGSRPRSFGVQSLQARPAWYRVGLALPQTTIYRVTRCDG